FIIFCSICLLFCYALDSPPPPASTLFPYTTLFRSGRSEGSRLSRSTQRAFRSSGTDGSSSFGGGGSKARFLIITSSDRPANGSRDRKSTRLNSSHGSISYAVFCLKKKI